MKVALHTIGCKVNFAETSQLREKFEMLGYDITENNTESDIIVFNTCTVTNKADADARKLIRRAGRDNPDAFIAVTGCYAQMKPEDVAKIEGVSAVFGQKEKFQIPNLISNLKNKDKTQLEVSCADNIPFDFATTYENENRTRGFIKLQDGCDYFCSFCTIPYARGRSRSMNFNSIRRQFEKLKDAGYKEVIISGINLGTYKAPTGENFTDVVRLIDTFDMGIRVRISSIEPNLLNDDIIEVVSKSDVFVPHFHIPLQSGSDEILKKMRRKYNSEYYKELILKINKKIPDVCIGVDVIVGFPGETDELFLETYNLLKSLPVSYLHVFTYSEREGTKAAAMTHKVPERIRKGRTIKLRELSDEKKKAFYKSQNGKIKMVIPETYDKKTGTYTGWTENYVRVKFIAAEGIENILTPIKLREINEDIVLSEMMGN
jgi:threonylcarbamoyladenosine tRNA methylthiotransferase MtaB